MENYNLHLLKVTWNKLPVVVSYHIIVHNRLSLSMGSRGVAAGANPSLVSGGGQDTPWTSHSLQGEQCGVQYLTQGHLRSRDLNQQPSYH